MLGIAVIAWIAALVLAVVVLAFCLYEITWKARRLQADLARLRTVTGRLQGLQSDLAVVQRRLSGLDTG